MQPSMNPYASSAADRVPLAYENVKMLERECDLTDEEHDAMLRFCAGAPIPVPFGTLVSPPRQLLYNIQAELRELLCRKQCDIFTLEEESLASEMRLKAALVRNPYLRDDHPAEIWYRMSNSGERRLLQRTWKEQCDLLARILGALADEGFESL
ncbi:hypothetical protein B0F90DRAFT_1818847 [Multifurca ochricompacta]|uniref:Uncharacterized protein n=1 Tax=Multifurca ochricompacta TaxID=376703 RepID=A0AAD4QL00_9AGAM|nr:hypothetical protein B0F90DRAFT_1818847 [Multifurca ochricompacta]